MTNQRDRSRVRVCINDDQGVRHWFARLDDQGRPFTVTFDNIGTAALLSRMMAVATCKKLKADGFDAHVITPTGTLLYEDELAASTPKVQTAPTADRVQMQCNGILIVPGNPTGWYIRFPGHPIESIKGATPEECYQKLIENPRSAELLAAAEKYVAPPEPLADPREIERALRLERYGRMRPGNEY